MSDNLEALLEQQGKAFDAFKDTVETELKSKLGKDDPIVTEKLSKIEASLDAAVEAKAKLEAGLEAERKEREALEARINREGIKGSTESAKREIEIKDFNTVLAAHNADRKQAFTPLDAAGYDAYKSAFNSFLRKNDRMLTPEEVKVLSVGSDPDGGYFVTPDVTGRIVSKVYESSPMRQIASQQTISTDKLEGIEDLDEAGAGYAGETATGSDETTPGVGKWSIPVWWIDTRPKTTQQLLDDSAVDIEAWLSGKVGDKFARFEEAEFIGGATGKIRGITSYTTAADSGSGVTWGQIGHVTTGVNGDFPASSPADKLHDLIGTLKSAYLPNARFLTRRTVITKIRKFKDGTGNYLWQPSFVLGVPETIMGYPVARAEDMPALATGSLSMAFGDFGQAYQIVDRQGIRVLRDPYTAKPYVIFYTTKRTGGGVVNFEAVKFLKFAA
jgi:HK97 family phage major capsid protein